MQELMTVEQLREMGETAKAEGRLQDATFAFRAASRLASKQEQATKIPVEVAYTSAPETYDYPGTTTVARHEGAIGNRTFRRVHIPTRIAESQKARYLSGLHGVHDSVGWAKLVAGGLVKSA
jgi:hypothetical protein